MSEKEQTRYSDAELEEFRALINNKLKKAHEELEYYQDQIHQLSESENRFSSLEDGSVTLEKENIMQLASRQLKYIQHLDNALIRIQNKTYGVCRETGKLIPKDRLRAVPHATLSLEAKNKQK
jgi:DnaK suppressor protein